MKILVATVLLVALVWAEPPPSISKSYLPPSPNDRNSNGYPSGGPGGVVAARNLNHQHGPHGRSGLHNHGAQGYDQNASPFGRNGLDDTEPANYNFGYSVNDVQEGTDFGHHEHREDERAQGEYHVVLPDGRKQTVSYEADERGFKPRISYEDGDDLSRANGYDSNANNVHNHDHGNHGNGFSNGGRGNHANHNDAF